MAVVVPVHAEVVTYQYGFDNALVTNYTGSEDAMLLQGLTDTDAKSNRNYGGYEKLIVGAATWTGTTATRAVVRFDLSSLAGQYSAINSVTLRLRKVDTSSKEISLYSILPADAGWVAGTATGAAQSGSSCWSHMVYSSTSWAGTAGCGQAGTDYNATPLATLSTSSEGFYDFTFSGTSAALKALIDTWSGNQSSNAGMLLRATAEGGSTYGAAFVSNENNTGDGHLDSWRPALIIDYTVVPEPTTLGLLAVGGLSVLIRKKGKN